MAALFNVIDTQTNKTVAKEETAVQIANKFGCSHSNVRNYAIKNYKIKGRYLVVDAHKDSRVTDDLKKEWDKVHKAAEMLKNGTGKIKRVYIKGKYVKRTVPV